MKRSDGIACYYSYGTKEIYCDYFEILTQKPGEYRWTSLKDGKLPYCSVVTSETLGDNSFAVGRATVSGETTVGKINIASNVIYVPYAGEEYSFTSGFDVLQINITSCF